jgi:hypothetical protein
MEQSGNRPRQPPTAGTLDQIQFAASIVELGAQRRFGFQGFITSSAGSIQLVPVVIGIPIGAKRVGEGSPQVQPGAVKNPLRPALTAANTASAPNIPDFGGVLNVDTDINKMLTIEVIAKLHIM